MAEMGYDLIGTREVQKKSGKRFRNELYTFNEGSQMPINPFSHGTLYHVNPLTLTCQILPNTAILCQLSFFDSDFMYIAYPIV